MKRIIMGIIPVSLLAVMFSIVPTQTIAQSASKKPTTGTNTKAKKVTAEVKYKAHCGMVYSASDAKQYHYVCPMDHKPLTKIAANVKPGKTASEKR